MVGRPAPEAHFRRKTSRDLHWRLSVAIGCFGDVPADELGFAHAEDLVSTLCAERLAIERAGELGALRW